jgi:hypothetical protein
MWEVVVASDPKLCRQYAVECGEMARKATNPGHKQLLSNLAQTWLSLAIELERTHTLLDAYPPEASEHSAGSRANR